MNSQYNSEWHRLQIKWKNAEQVIYELATKTFLQDWCFLNPKFPDGKELCDLLIVFEKNVIIWQVKDLKLDDNWQYKKQDKEKNVKQLWWAKRRLFESQSTIILSNDRREPFVFDPKTVESIYLISALVGGGESFGSFMEEIKSHPVHIFNRQFIEIILDSLDTISDFIHYLQSKEIFLTKDRQVIINGWEEELLGPYLHNNRSFSEFDLADLIILEKWMREKIIQKPEYIAKKEEDKISYFWDNLIDKTHQWGNEYELVARELASMSRFERRLLSKAFVEGNINASKDKTYNKYRRFIPMLEKWITYCFLYQNNIESRQNMLMMLCYVARIEFNTPKVIGIATTQHTPNWSHDFLLMNIPELSNETIQKIKKIKIELNILSNPKQRNIYEEEYPT